MTLLYLLHRHEVDSVVAHCNYRLRGDESDKDMELVEQIAFMWGFECVSAVFDPEEAESQNTQLWARRLRYRMFRDIKRNTEADYIITAHHRDDQVETILQKILRGSGLGAWSGMDRLVGELFRPLLDTSKEEIVEFAGQMEVPYREDKSNESTYYSRNLIRKELAPKMDHLFPGWKENVLKIPDRAAEFEKMTEAIFKQVAADSSSLNRKKILELDPDLWPVLIHRFIEKNLPDYAISAGEVEQFKTIDRLQTGSGIQLGDETYLLRDRDCFRLTKEGKSLADITRLTKENLPASLFNERLVCSIKSWNGQFERESLKVDLAKMNWPVTIRRWQNGDRMQPLGMVGHKLISDILTDTKIAAGEKKEAILVESFDGIIHAIIFPHATEKQQVGLISEKGKCSSETKRVFQIEITF